jgi:hypothetical protein
LSGFELFFSYHVGRLIFMEWRSYSGVAMGDCKKYHVVAVNNLGVVGDLLCGLSLYKQKRFATIHSERIASAVFYIRLGPL